MHLKKNPWRVASATDERKPNQKQKSFEQKAFKLGTQVGLDPFAQSQKYNIKRSPIQNDSFKSKCLPHVYVYTYTHVRIIYHLNKKSCANLRHTYMYVYVCVCICACMCMYVT